MNQEIQHDRRWQDQAERAGGGNRTGGEGFLVSALQHGGEREIGERRHRGADQTCRRCQDDADHRYGDRLVGGDATQQHLQAQQQLPPDPTPFQRDAHEQRHLDRRIDQVLAECRVDAQRNVEEGDQRELARARSRSRRIPARHR
jgi:hypothetical protein